MITTLEVWCTETAIRFVCRRPDLEGEASEHLANADRGSVKGFSAGSRARLLEYIGRLPPILRPMLVTLTLPGKWEWAEDPRVHGVLFDTFYKAFMRKYPKAFAVWRKEWQRRGAVHWHIALYGSTPGLREWVSKTWNRIVAPGDGDHLRAGTRVEVARGVEAATTYLAKELAKAHQLTMVAGLVHRYGTCGRMWGTFGKRSILREFVQVRGVSVWSWLRLACGLDQLVRSVRKIRHGFPIRSRLDTRIRTES